MSKSEGNPNVEKNKHLRSTLVIHFVFFFQTVCFLRISDFVIRISFMAIRLLAVRADYVRSLSRKMRNTHSAPMISSATAISVALRPQAEPSSFWK